MRSSAQDAAFYENLERLSRQGQRPSIEAPRYPGTNKYKIVMGKMRKIEKSTAGPIVLPNRLNTITSPRSPEKYTPPQVVRSKAPSVLSSSGLSILKTEASFQSGVNHPYNNLDRAMPAYAPRDIQTRN